MTTPSSEKDTIPPPATTEAHASNQVSSSPSIELSVPTSNDFAAISELKAEAFADKMSSADGGREYRHYAKKHPVKLQHMRVARLANNPSSIVGAIQLQLHNDPGNYGLPGCMRHVLHHSEEAYIEFIATKASVRGQGVGSKLLQWAQEFAQTEGCRQLTLHVFQANKGAVRLYERKGFEIQHAEEGACLGSCFFCLVSCGKYWTFYYMIKDLTVET